MVDVFNYAFGFFFLSGAVALGVFVGMWLDDVRYANSRNKKISDVTPGDFENGGVVHSASGGKSQERPDGPDFTAEAREIKDRFYQRNPAVPRWLEDSLMSNFMECFKRGYQAEREKKRPDRPSLDKEKNVCMKCERCIRLFDVPESRVLGALCKQCGSILRTASFNEYQADLISKWEVKTPPVCAWCDGALSHSTDVECPMRKSTRDCRCYYANGVRYSLCPVHGKGTAHEAERMAKGLPLNYEYVPFTARPLPWQGSESRYVDTVCPNGHRGRMISRRFLGEAPCLQCRATLVEKTAAEQEALRLKIREEERELVREADRKKEAAIREDEQKRCGMEFEASLRLAVEAAKREEIERIKADPGTRLFGQTTAEVYRKLQHCERCSGYKAEAAGKSVINLVCAQCNKPLPLMRNNNCTEHCDDCCSLGAVSTSEIAPNISACVPEKRSMLHGDIS